MDIRTAILKAADSIDGGAEYNFSAIEVPSDCGSPGCMLGWIGFHLGMAGALVQIYVAPLLFGIAKKDGDQIYCKKFYRQIREISDCLHGHDNREIARTLRIYADKYHPEVKRGIPDSVLSLFREVA